MAAGSGVMELPENNLPQWKDLPERTLSATILAIMVLMSTWIGGIAFVALVILAVILMFREWEELTAHESEAWRLVGYPYLIFPAACLIWLRDLDDGRMLVIALIAVISATDIGAYFIGKRFGRHKMAPTISPNKTWEGLGGGVCAALLTGLLFSPFISLPHTFLSAVFVSLLMPLSAQAGDLFKSSVKRRAGVKDSGTLLPGHGGLIDRVDGYMFSAPLLAFFVFLGR